ncbi:MAG: IMP 5'-nucleotidase [Chaenotheca gracillima]|nr:MAG: IMP 5'-nucleotidase [Chaenotheca gracillima]
MDSEMTAASDPLSLSLRAWPVDDANTKSLPSLIARVNQQPGGFRSLTESGLEEEIAASATIHEDQTDGLGDDEDVDAAATGDQRKEDLLTAKGEILGHLRQANNDAMMALDFISLLLSKDTPRVAEISMSPYLKQQVPLGSLGAERIQLPVVSEEVKKDRNDVVRGWKLEALNSSADMILSSANRLEKEIEQETKYWEQVLAISKRGWSICRQPREKHTLGVRFGFREAAPEFRDRGLASLRRGDDGEIVLDQGLINATPKSVRVRVQTAGGDVTGCSRARSAIAAEASTEDLILQARNTIFEEELMHEINREARLLSNQGVRNVGTALAIDALDQRFLIDLVPLEDDHPPEPSELGKQDELANALAIALRILLSYAHRQNLQRRSKEPPPLTERPRENPPYYLLRPVVTHLFHQSAIRSTTIYLDSLKAILKSAGLEPDHALEVGTNCKALASNNPSNSKATVESVVQTVLDRLESSVKITLRESATINVKIRTQLAAPTLGTEYVITASNITSAPNSMRFGTAEEFERYVDHLTTLALIDEVSSYSSTRGTSTSSPTSDKTLGETADGDPPESGWGRGAQLNELQKSFKKTGRGKLMVFQFSNAVFRLKWGWMGGKASKGEGTYAWDASASGEEKKTLKDIAALAGRFEI